MESKKPWLSKTLWVNALMGVLPFFPGMDEFVKSHPDVLISVVAVVNVLLRLITKDKLSLS